MNDRDEIAHAGENRAPGRRRIMASVMPLSELSLHPFITASMYSVVVTHWSRRRICFHVLPTPGTDNIAAERRLPYQSRRSLDTDTSITVEIGYCLATSGWEQEEENSENRSTSIGQKQAHQRAPLTSSASFDQQYDSFR